MKKVLVVTYYWPPAGGPGVQRVLKFIKYLAEFGWQPIVLTVKCGEYHAIDESLDDEISETVKIYKTNAIEPHKLYKKFSGMKQTENVPYGVLVEKNISWKKRLSFWIRANLFIPDARIGWIPFAVKKGKKIIENHKIDVIFSSAPPPTVHLISKKLSKWSGIKWVADFRDPWTGIYYFEDYNRLAISKKIDEALERSVLKSADAVSSVSNLDVEEDYVLKVPNKQKYFYIPNGYDESDFKDYSVSDSFHSNSNKFNIMHLGTVSEERNPKNLFKAIKKLNNNKLINQENFSVTFVGNIEPSIIEEYMNHNIEKYITLIPYVSHEKIFTYMKGCTILLLLITNTNRNKGIVPGKTFEYLRSGKPLLVFGSVDGEVANIVNKTKAGNVINYEDFNSTYKYLEMLLKDFSNGKFE